MAEDQSTNTPDDETAKRNSLTQLMKDAAKAAVNEVLDERIEKKRTESEPKKKSGSFFDAFGL